MDENAEWEPIDEKHKTGSLIVIMHKRSPEDAVCVRWNGHQWVGAYIEDFGMLAYSEGDVAVDFTHAYTLPELTPRPA